SNTPGQGTTVCHSRRLHSIPGQGFSEDSSPASPDDLEQHGQSGLSGQTALVSCTRPTPTPPT
ncbi:hypothetical protein NDU88_007119, partial [Pleurodeles waltl]